MTPKFTLVTPTADQPAGLTLCERFMAAQTLDVRQCQWIVVDDGVEAAALTMGQKHIRRPREADCTPTQSFCRNLLAALPQVKGEWIVFIEHDDYYTPAHLEMLAGLAEKKGAQIVGDGMQRYYNVHQRCYRVFENYGACLCQTAISVSLMPMITKTIEDLLKRNKYGVDAQLWRNVPESKWGVKLAGSALGIKGLPGRAGLGLGHRPTTDGKWTADPDLAMLRSWIGDAADIYAGFSRDMQQPTSKTPTPQQPPAQPLPRVPTRPPVPRLLDAVDASRALSVDMIGLLKLERRGKIKVEKIERGCRFYTHGEVERVRQVLGAGR